METPIIEIKSVGKRYNINHHLGGYVTLRDVIANTFKSPLKFLKAKAKKIAGIDTKEDFWALKDVSFNVQKGEVIGIIGPNGSGKSTLLKILSQITPPTEGEIIIQGKVGSLLEVGTGFHGELSGRENIFLNGAILGMSKKEIREKFDRIVEFSGIGKFIDTPVKYYSSGMYVRLAFSVAAHMDPDILIIDEVLAVGDMEFQKKCLGKMDDITKEEGRTILFVSHNMDAIEKLCKRCIVLKNGSIDYIGGVEESINRYMENSRDVKKTWEEGDPRPPQGPGIFSRFLSVKIQNDSGLQTDTFKMGEPITVILDFEIKKQNRLVEIGFHVQNMMNTNLYSFTGEWEGLPKTFDAGKHRIICRVESLLCFPGSYGITPWILESGGGVDQKIEHAVPCNVTYNDVTGHEPDYIHANMGVYQKSEWKLEKLV